MNTNEQLDIFDHVFRYMKSNLKDTFKVIKQHWVSIITSMFGWIFFYICYHKISMWDNNLILPLAYKYNLDTNLLDSIFNYINNALVSIVAGLTMYLSLKTFKVSALLIPLWILATLISLPIYEYTHEIASLIYSYGFGSYEMYNLSLLINIGLFFTCLLMRVKLSDILKIEFIVNISILIAFYIHSLLRQNLKLYTLEDMYVIVGLIVVIPILSRLQKNIHINEAQ